jgi:hypothetical protein
MYGELGKLRESLAEVVGELRPECLDPRDAVRLVERFSSIEKLAAAGKALAARRVASSGAWKGKGDRSAAHFLARTTGTSLGAATALLETSQRLAELEKTEEAFRKGKLSETQAKEITSGASASPSSEDELLALAESDSVAGLRQAARKAIANAETDECSRYQEIHRSRYLRHWSDPDGAFRADIKLTPDAGAGFLASLEPYIEQIFESARKANPPSRALRGLRSGRPGGDGQGPPRSVQRILGAHGHGARAPRSLSFGARPHHRR